MKDDLKWLSNWLLNGGPTDLLVAWVTLGLLLLSVTDDVHRIPNWIVVGWIIVVLGWVYYRIFHTAQNYKKDKQE